MQTLAAEPSSLNSSAATAAGRLHDPHVRNLAENFVRHALARHQGPALTPDGGLPQLVNVLLYCNTSAASADHAKLVHGYRA